MATPLPPVDGLRCFVAVAEHLDFRRAATEVLHPEAYALVAAPVLLARVPFAAATDAARHTILDIDGALPLLRYASSVCPGLVFGDLWRCGTGAAIHGLVRAGQGIAVLPLHMVQGDLEAGRLVQVLPGLELLTDTFRLIYRKSSPQAATLSVASVRISSSSAVLSVSVTQPIATLAAVSSSACARSDQSAPALVVAIGAVERLVVEVPPPPSSPDPSSADAPSSPGPPSSPSSQPATSKLPCTTKTWNKRSMRMIPSVSHLCTMRNQALRNVGVQRR